MRADTEGSWCGLVSMVEAGRCGGSRLVCEQLHGLFNQNGSNSLWVVDLRRPAGALVVHPRVRHRCGRAGSEGRQGERQVSCRAVEGRRAQPRCSAPWGVAADVPHVKEGKSVHGCLDHAGADVASGSQLKAHLTRGRGSFGPARLGCARPARESSRRCHLKWGRGKGRAIYNSVQQVMHRAVRNPGTRS